MKVPCATRAGPVDLADVDQVAETVFSAEMVASGLASIFRYGGYAGRPWSVAAHSVIVSRLCETPAAQAWGLLHDAHEIILGDTTTPAARLVEHIVGDNGFGERRHQAAWVLDQAVAIRWGLADTLSPHVLAEVRRADVLAGIAERLLQFAEPIVSNEEAAEGREALYLIHNSGLRWTYEGAFDAKGAWLREAHTLAHLGALTLPGPRRAR